MKLPKPSKEYMKTALNMVFGEWVLANLEKHKKITLELKSDGKIKLEHEEK